ncbi:TetR/AcrR family transcriptional regulator [Sinomonas sp. P10A9]|uniref:TetR/AcrR family transcriptional regulator n=1 Tax=Sinomonas puerhi TaxID=3238584 RepID=A0AB39L3J4_9MICC
MEGKQERSRERRRRMADAAARLLISDGPAAITHRAVAEAAGLAPGSGNYYFPTKQVLYAAAVEGAEDLRLRAAQARAAELDAQPRTLEEIARELMDVFFAPGLAADVVVLRLLPMLDAGRDAGLQRIMQAHRPLLAEAVNAALERMTGRRLADRDVELVMQVIAAGLLHADGTEADAGLAAATATVARVLELLGLRGAAGQVTRRSMR